MFPKYAEDAGEIRWFELPASYAFHVANAWQEGNIIRIFLSLYEEGVSYFLLFMDYIPANCRSFAKVVITQKG